MIDEVMNVVSGVVTIVEVISLMMWVHLEGTKFSLFGISTALRNENIAKAKQCLNETGVKANDGIWYWLVMYGFPASPSWPAYYAFNYMGRLALDWRKKEIEESEQMMAMGYHRDKNGNWYR